MPTDLNQLPLPAFYESLTHSGLVNRLLGLARDEDFGIASTPGDISSLTSIAADAVAVAEISSRSGGVIAGLATVPDVLKVFAPATKFESYVRDGDRVSAQTALGLLSGPTRELLGVERTLLNLVGRLSGIATLTGKYVAAAGKGTKSGVYDTRKTTPGLRVLEKYAVRCGGGKCHRMGLFDAMLLKDNHLAGVELAKLGAWVEDAAAKARKLNPALQFVMVEVDSLEQLAQIVKLKAGVVDIVLLDNMNSAKLGEAVAMRNNASPTLELEASGGVNLETIASIAASGVDRISVGALTHQAVSLDVGLDFRT